MKRFTQQSMCDMICPACDMAVPTGNVLGSSLLRWLKNTSVIIKDYKFKTFSGGGGGIRSSIKPIESSNVSTSFYTNEALKPLLCTLK